MNMNKLKLAETSDNQESTLKFSGC
uniref:Uncharacterized protein n=1 Tax=Anguilla anguilla TaxID=7936 RepID=A0A0E9PUL1_ANGAN